MADWRQIRARIRRAKSGPDATARLEQLFDKTRDGMVAFELAQLEETAGRTERATDWYKRAWLRFRRSEWKQKAEEALTRHGIPIPTDHEEEELGEEVPAREAEAAPAEAESPEEPKEKEPERETAAAAAKPEAKTKPRAEAKPKAEAKKAEAEVETEAEAEAETAAEAAPASEAEPEAADEAEAKPESPASRRRRRRRGGRGRGRRKERGEAAARPEAEAPAHAPARPTAPRVKEPKEPKEAKETKEAQRRPAAERRPAREPARERAPAIHIYRRGEPALASKIKVLEAKLRQLLAAHPYPLDQLGEVPASPGVYLVSDLDLTTMYHLEAFGNMRQAMDQLVSGRRGRQGSVRARLARYLGISDSQASRYLKQHCVVRWIDLEESDAVALGHFAMALLRPELMDETA